MRTSTSGVKPAGRIRPMMRQIGPEDAMSQTLPPPEELARLLYTPVVSDVLDGFGLMRQALRPFVRPLDESLVLFGRARTGHYETLTAPSASANPYELEMD